MFLPVFSLRFAVRLELPDQESGFRVYGLGFRILGAPPKPYSVEVTRFLLWVFPLKVGALLQHGLTASAHGTSNP